MTNIGELKIYTCVAKIDMGGGGIYRKKKLWYA